MVSGLDQLREKWVSNPVDYLSSVALHPQGVQVIVTNGRGDLRERLDDIELVSLGARFSRDEAASGYLIEHIYKAAPITHISPDR